MKEFKEIGIYAILVILGLVVCMLASVATF